MATVNLVDLTRRPVSIAADAHVVVAVVRNEILRLPFFISYYRDKGFDTFVFIDNESTDGTRDFLVAQPDAVVLGVSQDYAASRHGLTWTNAVLNQLCVGRWVLVVDADEQLVWPNSEHETIVDLTRRLDAAGAEALFTILLDMYSDRPFGEIGYEPGAPFIEFSRFFDATYRMTRANIFPHRQLYGGVRMRAFSMVPDERVSPPTASKVPLVKWRQGQSFVLSTHGLQMPMPLAAMRGALLHFKMFDDLVEKCHVEVERGQHFAGGREYRLLGAAIDRLPGRTFHDPEISRQYADTAGLTSLGILNARAPF